MKKVKFLPVFILTIVLAGSLNIQKVSAHCEIPCGIYDDELRIALIKEHITTIEKSINQINELTKNSDVGYNQIVRWINNKEEHAQKIQDIVSQYFLHQRIKIKDSEDKEAFELYQKQLISLHKMLVFAMKTKQTTDIENIEKLRNTLAEFEGLYFHKHE